MSVLDLGCSIIAKPNNSLSVKNNILLLLAIASVALVVALGFAQMGAWLVLPFAGLEVVAFACAFYYVHLHSTDYECISIEDDSVVVEKRSNKEISKAVFLRYWVQVSVRNVVINGVFVGRTRLYIGSHGKEVEFGGNLISDEQRLLLAQAIKRKIKSID